MRKYNVLRYIIIHDICIYNYMYMIFSINFNRFRAKMLKLVIKNLSVESDFSIKLICISLTFDFLYYMHTATSKNMGSTVAFGYNTIYIYIHVHPMFLMIF